MERNYGRALERAGPQRTAGMMAVPQVITGPASPRQPAMLRPSHSSRVCGDAGVHTYRTASHVKVWHTHSCTVHDTQ